MAIKLNKSTGINLKKGSSISLEKDGKRLEQVCIGLNWGAMQKSSLFGLVKHTENVDLDGSVTMFDSHGKELDTVYYGNLVSGDQSIRHSGDDVVGDTSGDDALDNEVIQINLLKVKPQVETIFIYLNSYKRQDFAHIPYSKVRVFEGNNKEVRSVFATFNLSADPSFAGNVSMIMGKLVRTRSSWEFITIGEPISARDIKGTIETIQNKYL